MGEDINTARWEGSVEQQLKDHDRRLGLNETDVNDLRTLIARLNVELSAIRTKVALAAAAGSIVGAGIVSYVVAHVH